LPSWSAARIAKCEDLRYVPLPAVACIETPHESRRGADDLELSRKAKRREYPTRDGRKVPG
jgi:hypothetical protein